MTQILELRSPTTLHGSAGERGKGLAGDEGGEADADEPAAHDEARGVLHVHHAENGEGGDQQAGRHSPPGANRVSDEPHDEAEEDGGA